LRRFHDRVVITMVLDSSRGIAPNCSDLPRKR
jgi:hypothetical protein